MSRRTTDLFDCIRTQGGLLPSDFLARIADPAEAKNITGLAPADYHLTGSQKITEAINRSWNTLQGCWQDLKAKVAALPKDDAATGVTRDLWLLPLFQELGYGRLQSAPKLEIEERHYPISHMWGHTPIHLLGVGLDLDRTTKGAAGAARMSPHSMVQEFLNRSTTHLWAILSNGYKLRLLRDNATLTRQAFVEFDLYTMFEGEAYSDFVLLWLLCHQSRVESERPESCILEKWTNESRQNGVRLLDGLRTGVEQAIEHLGAGFLAHPNNHALKDRLRKGELSTQDYYRQILRQVYRFLFLFVAEDRELLLRPDASESAKTHYRRFYSTRRLRQLAERHGGTRHGDLWELLKLVTKALGSNEGCPALGLPALGSFLWRANDSTPDLINASLDNRHLLDAIRALATVRSEEEKVRRIVDYRNLGPEELGSVYESLLELHPEIHAESAVFKLNTSAGSDRKTTGSYYTPDSLVQCLLDSALEPVVKERLAAAKTREEKEQAILTLKVCDKACGSGHFLIAAAHRLARTLAAIRSGEDEPSPLLYQHALRDVISRCIYGVDLNPMAVELCKITLWLEAIEPGKPLSFLDHHIQCGNSLLGATPALMAKGIPDEAFEPIEGDEKPACSALKKLNARQREGFGVLFGKEDEEIQQRLRAAAAAIDQIDDSSADGITKKESAYASSKTDALVRRAKDLADLWCAAFVIPKSATSRVQAAAPALATDPTASGPTMAQSALLGFDAPTEKSIKSAKKIKKPSVPLEDLHGITSQHLHDFANGGKLPDGLLEEAQKLAELYQFFHWQLAFPEVFKVPSTGQKPENELCGWNGGFDVLVGNPPWERVKLQEKEWFAARGRNDVANAASATIRKRLIGLIKAEDTRLHSKFVADCRKADGEGHLLRNSGLYPLCGRGDVNLYALFGECMRTRINPSGRVGCILPSGIAADDTTKQFFQDIIEMRSLVSFFDFENRRGLFPAVDSRMKFCLITLGGLGAKAVKSADFVFFAHKVEDLNDSKRQIQLSADDIALFNPISKTCPIFRFRRDFELSKHIHGRGVLLEGKEWGGYYIRLIHLDDHSESVAIEEELGEGHLSSSFDFTGGTGDYNRVIEPKLVHHFDHRYGTFEGVQPADAYAGKAREVMDGEHCNPSFAVKPRYWVRRALFCQIIAKYGAQRGWLLGYRDITNTTNERTSIATVIPETATTVSMPCIGVREAVMRPLLHANLSAFAFDFATRTKVPGTHLTWGILKQLPLLPPATYSQPCAWFGQSQTLQAWLLPRVLELTYTAWDLEAFAQDCGWSGPPFRWDEDRRFLLRCELDAAFFHLYGLNRDDAAYIMDTFPIVRRKDEARTEQTNAAGEVIQPGRYITKDTILEIYDALAESIKTGQPYKSRLSPAAASIHVAHPPRFNHDRVTLEVGDYILGFVFSMLRYSGGTCDLMRLVRGYALLQQPKVLASLVEAQFDAPGSKWVEKSTQKHDARWFLPILRRMETHDMVSFEVRGDDVIVHQKDPQGPKVDAAVGTDAFLVMRVLDVAPERAIAESVKRIVPKAPRVALQEAVPA